MTDKPTLVVVSGPSGFGKTTLAHELARAIPCIAICRDEIKEGMVYSSPGFEAAPGDALTKRSSEVFFHTVEALARAGTTLVAEAAFQHELWTWFLNRLEGVVRVVVVQCHVDAAAALRRVESRGVRPAHADAQFLASVTADDVSKFQRLQLDAPCIDVDTTDGYEPSLDAIVEFIAAS